MATGAGRGRRRNARGVFAATAVALVLATTSPLSALVVRGADVTVAATAETAPVPSVGDAADDIAIWIHPTDPSLSTVIGTDKLSTGGLGVYDLAGNQLYFYLHGSLNNVDLRYNFPLGAERVALVGVTDRNDLSTGARFYKVNVADRSLTLVGRIDTSGRPRGFGMYHSPSSGKYYAFLTDFSTNVVSQYELNGSTGTVTGTLVRSFDNGNTSEGIVADDELQRLYVAEEDVALWRYGAEPGDGSTRTSVDSTTLLGGNIQPNIKNPAIYYGRNGTGYLIVSSQGGSNFVVYDRGSNVFIGSFKVGAGNGVDAVSGQDGADVTNFPLGSAFPQGLFGAQDHSNTNGGNGNAGNQNYKYAGWGAIANAFSPPLLVDTLFDPRTIGAPSDPGTSPPETIITSGPSGTVTDTTATFTFDASQAGSTFACRLDGGTFDPCTSPRTYASLAEGTHTFEVRATNAGGYTDATPASRTWTIDLSAPVSVAFPAEADATVEAAIPDTNLGSATVLGADTSPQKESYLRFNVQGLAGTVQSARLRLYASNGSTNGPAAYGTATSWSEAGITWNSGRPARTTGVLEDKATIPTGTWVEWNVSAVVTGNGLYSFNLAPTSSDGTDMSSREAASNRPELVVLTSSGGGGDTTPPETTIDSGPSGTVGSTSATFTFSSSEAGSTFECRLDAAAFSACASPAGYSGLAAGAHTFEVRATDAALNTDPTPASRAWTVDLTPPTVTTVVPADLTADVTVGANVTATFSETMDSSSITTTTFTLKRTADAVGVPATVTYNTTDRRATLDPSANLEPSTSYTATVTTGARDSAGNAMASDRIWSFTTAADVPPPPSGGIVRESVSTVANATATGQVAIPKPAGTAQGDLLMACLALNGGGIPLAGVPAGWTLVAAVPGVTNPKVFGYYRVAGASEPAIYTWTLSSAVANGAGIARYSGVDPAQPLDGAPTTAAAGSGTSAVLPGVTTTAPNAMLVGCVGINSSSASTGITSPPGMTQAWDIGGKRHELADGIVAAAGPTGTRTWTLSASRAWAGWLVALRD